MGLDNDEMGLDNDEEYNCCKGIKKHLLNARLYQIGRNPRKSS